MQTATVIGAKLANLGFRPLPEEEPAPVVKPKSVQKKVKQIQLHDGENFVLIFACPRRLVYGGIQVLPAGGGNVVGKIVPGTGRFRKAKVDLGGLMVRCVVDTINVRERQGHCRVYVNCIVGVGEKRGFHDWHGAYEMFVRKEMARTWDRAVLKKPGGNGRTSLEVSGTYEGDAMVELDFAIKR